MAESPAADAILYTVAFSPDYASVRITLLRPHLRVSCQPLEHLLRYRARPPFALERLSVIRGEDGRLNDLVPPPRKHRHCLPP